MGLLKANILQKCFKVTESVKIPVVWKCSLHLSRGVSSEYIQGQSPEQSIREYFYYINHEGMLFLDDTKMKNFTSCYKDIRFLQFFFKRLRLNTTDRYPEFPFVSLCGRERNFVRCDDCPVVFTHVAGERLHYGHAGDLLSTQFKPHSLYMSPASGRVYHPALATSGSVGLVQSKLAIELSRHFTFANGEESGPTHFRWRGTEYVLQTDWYERARGPKKVADSARESPGDKNKEQSVAV
ncbi:UPF0598 protein CG30010 [Bacillus rossius redtenbacheri]|uniref:UPF0598 protein CG30010 n=1 Tax=Bacillus rossius redtenbacheri TaxID=93214 RepID=UPI002FDCBA0D